MTVVGPLQLNIRATDLSLKQRQFNHHPKLHQGAVAFLLVLLACLLAAPSAVAQHSASNTAHAMKWTTLKIKWQPVRPEHTQCCQLQHVKANLAMALQRVRQSLAELAKLAIRQH